MTFFLQNCCSSSSIQFLQIINATQELLVGEVYNVLSATYNECFVVIDFEPEEYVVGNFDSLILKQEADPQSCINNNSIVCVPSNTSVVFITKIDISTAVEFEPINNKYATTSVLPTGRYSRLLIRKNYPKNLTIANIQSKFANRFDNISYYNCCPVDGGDVE